MLEQLEVVPVQAAAAEALEVVVVGPAGVGVGVHRRRRPSSGCRCPARGRRRRSARSGRSGRRSCARGCPCRSKVTRAGGRSSSSATKPPALVPRTLIFLRSPSTPVPVPGRGLVLEVVRAPATSAPVARVDEVARERSRPRTRAPCRPARSRPSSSGQHHQLGHARRARGRRPTARSTTSTAWSGVSDRPRRRGRCRRTACRTPRPCAAPSVCRTSSPP